MAFNRLLLAISLTLAIRASTAVDYKGYERKFTQLPKLDEKSYGYKPQKSKFEEDRNDQYPKLEEPNAEEESQLTSIGVQGLVYCQSGPKLTPLQGAVVRVTCLTTDAYGNELTPFSIFSEPTDSKGNFFVTMALSNLRQLGKVSVCKTFLNSSPSDTCNIPTDANNGLRGARLSSQRFLAQQKMNLCSVGPLIYTLKPASINNGY